MSELARYEAARRAVAEAKSIDEILSIRDEARRMEANARIAKDHGMIADAVEIQMRAERRLGEEIGAAKASGLIILGRPKKNGSNQEPLPRIRLQDIGIDNKLSHDAQRAAALSKCDFENRVDQTRDRIESRGAHVINPLSTAEKQAKRAERERELADKIAALPEKKYGVVLADPEWRFEPWSRLTGMDRAADNHYPTSVLERIQEREVASLAADDCVLFLWATVPMLPHAIIVMGAWGFDYRTNFVWVKERIGTGYWNRNKHEHLLVGVRGDPPAPAMGDQWDSALRPKQPSEHSRKPDYFYQLIEAYYPNVPKIELNARRKRDGWDAWGNEAE